ncbi:unnamed protein product [Cylindrotheca closterium]|uniref:Uncharacterized protein n=1 Tax=Cylindrotheca closterium TaxID=2856 RepID=A0AAD2JI45_9STRA|nr:unnamed protein product [Cylindrotheca closterium]
MRLSKFLSPSRYLTLPSIDTFKYSSPFAAATKRRRSQQKKEAEQLPREQQETEQSLSGQQAQTDEECGATLFNVEMVALAAERSTLVFEEEREAMAGEAEASHEVRKESETQRQDVDIRRYGLATDCREEPDEEESDQEPIQLRKVANRTATKTSEENDYEPSFIDTLCFSSKAASGVIEESHAEDDASQVIKLDQNAPPPPYRLVGGYIYKNHKDTPMGMSIKNSTTKQGVYISDHQIGSRFKWSTDLAVDGMQILSINGLSCPSDLEVTVDMMKQAEGDLKLIAAVIDPPKVIAPFDDDEDSLESLEACNQEEDGKESGSEALSDSESDSEDGVSALTDEKQRATQSSYQETNSKDANAPETTPVLALLRERSTIQFI